MILQLLRIVLAWKRFILFSAIVCCVVAVGVAAMIPPVYQSVARVQMGIGSDPITGGSINYKYADAYLGTQVELIRDYSVAGRVVDATGLVNSPEMVARYRASVPDQTVDYRRWLAQQIIAGTGVGLVPESNIIEIQYVSTTPATATSMAELIRAAYIDQTLSFQRDRAFRSAEWFDQEAVELRGRLTAAQAAKTEFERENGVIVTRDGQSLDEMRIGSQAATLPNLRPSILPASVAAPSASALAQAEARVAAASRTMGPNHPILLQLREQESTLREAVARETAALNATVAAPEAPQGVSAAQIDRVLSHAGRINEARRLAINANVLQEQYQAMAKRAADLRLEAGSLDAGLIPVGEASRPTRPLTPNWGLIVGLSLGFGFALGCLTALLLDLLSLPVRSADELELAGVPTLNAQTPLPPKPKRRGGDGGKPWPWGTLRFFTQRQEA